MIKFYSLFISCWILSLNAQNVVKMDVKFTKKLDTDVSLAQLREKTLVRIYNHQHATIKARAIFKIEKKGVVVYQTNIYSAPILNISAGDNYFEGEILIAAEASQKGINIDSNTSFKYDLFYFNQSNEIQHLTMDYHIKITEDLKLKFYGNELVHESKPSSFNDFRSRLTYNYLRDNANNGKKVSESVIGYIQMQQTLAMEFENNKLRARAY